MTKILLISNKSDLTTDFIVKKLTETCISFYRFNTEELGVSLSLSIDFEKEKYLLFDKILKVEFDLAEFSSVYYRRPEIPKIEEPDLSSGEQEFLRGELLYSLEGIYKLLRKAYWVSPLYSIREAENKVYQIELAKSLGFIIPPSLITTIPEKAVYFFEKHNQHCVIKPIKSGLIEDTNEPKVIFTSKLKDFYQNSSRIESCPTYFQKEIEKKADVRVTVVGDSIFPALIHSQEIVESQTDWRRSEIPLKYSKIDLPEDIKTKCIQLLQSLNLRFGAIDFILDVDGRFIFLEINPNGQWGWIEKQLEYDISGAIVKLLVNENF
jgi:glutathione synthase/RimK-type ligase-like ATP-grasp enzyme